MLKVAVCWSGLTKGLTNAVSFNKQLFDSIYSTHDEIEFDHFCHFWNKNNKYLYDFDETLFGTQFKELDGIATENPEHVCSIIDILDPKTVVFTDFNSMGKQLLGNRFFAVNPQFIEFKTIAEQQGTHIHKTIANMERWGYSVHHQYCRLINHLAQLYSFEKVVSLAKAHNKDYDVIIRMRYDTVLAPGDISNLITSMYKAKSDDTILVRWFELTEVNSHDTKFLYNTSIETVADTGKRWGIDDPVFVGSASCMYKLSDNIFDNSYEYFCVDNNQISLFVEHLWFKEMCNKHIRCNAIENSVGYVILRSSADLDIFKEFHCNVYRYRIEHRNKLPEFNGIIAPELPSVDWSDTQKYVILPDTYILASMLKLILDH